MHWILSLFGLDKLTVSVASSLSKTNLKEQHCEGKLKIKDLAVGYVEKIVFNIRIGMACFRLKKRGLGSRMTSEAHSDIGIRS